MEQESTEQRGTGQSGMDLGSTDLKNAGSGGTVQKSTGKAAKHKGKRKKKRRKKKSPRKLTVRVNLEPKSFLAGIAAGVLLTLLVMFLLTRCSAEEVDQRAEPGRVGAGDQCPASGCE